MFYSLEKESGRFLFAKVREKSLVKCLYKIKVQGILVTDKLAVYMRKFINVYQC
jgi:hypothetical protein